MPMKKIIIILICAIFASLVYIILIFDPIFIGKTDIAPLKSHDVDSLYNPIDSFDFLNGSNEIIIRFDYNDLQSIPHTLRKWLLLSCTDNATIQRIKANFWFEQTSAETTDGNTYIYFLKDRRVVFQSPFSIEGNIGIKTVDTGWSFTVRYDSLVNDFAKFKPMYNPLIMLHK
jgi:hypothetical protein